MNQQPDDATGAPTFDPLVEDQSKPVGEKMENLAVPLRLWIWNLYVQQERQDEIPRRNEICTIFERKNYYRGEQYWWYSQNQAVWNPPSVTPIGQESDYEQPPFQYVTNIVRAYSEGLQSVLSQNNTAARFWPEKPSKPEDIQTAQNASKVVDLIHRNNDWQNLIDEATYFMCTDGFFGGYVRHVTDAERFGTEEIDILGTQDVEVAPSTVECPCGYQNVGTTETQPVCPNCAENLHDIPPVTAQVPSPMGTMNIPKGQTCITIVPALNLRRTMYANDQQDFLYMAWVQDVHKAKAMSEYPWVRDSIKGSSGAYGNGSIANTYEQVARRLLFLGSGRHTGTATVLQDVGELRKVWMRPCVLELVDDDVARLQLQKLFTKGICVTFYNDVYCEASDECMDECWETMQTCDGEGQVRPTLISSIMPIQDQLNDATNLLFEQVMNGVPETFADQNTLDFEARAQQVAAPGNTTPVDLKPGQDIRSKVLVGTSVEPAQALVLYQDKLLNEISQFLTGYFPALGGGDTGANDTASGIAIQRNQALGRIGRAWRRLQTFCCNLDGKSVNCFQKYMMQDTEIGKKSGSGDYTSDWIRVEDMQGNVVSYPEVDAQYPTLQADMKSLLQGWFNSGNPIFLAWMQDPSNAEYFLRESGAIDIQVPGEQQRKKTMADIEALLQEAPQQVESPQTPGMPPQPPQLIPSIQPDALIDNLQVAGEAVKNWFISDEGQEAKQSNPVGFSNVYAYAKAIDQLAKQASFQSAVVSQALQGQGPASDLSGAEQHLQAPPSNNPSEPAAETPSPSGSQP